MSADHERALRRLGDTLREAGALGLVQIFHGGLRADRAVSGEEPLSASAGTEPARRAATEDDLERIVEAFAASAERTHAAGLGGVEIHGAHGYLPAQFISTSDNQRADQWGGSLENRARLLRRITQEVRRRVPAPFVVGVRLSPEDFGQTRGVDLDENVQIARWLEQAGVDFLHLSLWDVARHTAKVPAEHAVSYFRKQLPADLVLFAAGKIWTREDAEGVLERGADVVALGRSAILNPDWPQRVATGDAEPLLPPISREALAERAVSPAFADYLRVFKGLVS